MSPTKRGGDGHRLAALRANVASRSARSTSDARPNASTAAADAAAPTHPGTGRGRPAIHPGAIPIPRASPSVAASASAPTVNAPSGISFPGSSATTSEKRTGRRTVGADDGRTLAPRRGRARARGARRATDAEHPRAPRCVEETRADVFRERTRLRVAQDDERARGFRGHSPGEEIGAVARGRGREGVRERGPRGGHVPVDVSVSVGLGTRVRSVARGFGSVRLGVQRGGDDPVQSLLVELEDDGVRSDALDDRAHLIRGGAPGCAPCR